MLGGEIDVGNGTGEPHRKPFLAIATILPAHHSGGNLVRYNVMQPATAFRKDIGPGGIQMRWPRKAKPSWLSSMIPTPGWQRVSSYFAALIASCPPGSRLSTNFAATKARGTARGFCSGHSYCFGQNRGNAEEIRPILLQLGEFVEPLRGFFFCHAPSAHDERSDDLRDPIAEASRIIGSVQDWDWRLPQRLDPRPAKPLR